MGPGEAVAAGAAAAGLRIEVVYCAGRGQVDGSTLTLPVGATLADALHASGVLQRHPGLDATQVGVWSRPATPSQPLRDGDRVELYRPLQVEPKDARRQRHRQAVARKPRA